MAHAAAPDADDPLTRLAPGRDAQAVFADPIYHRHGVEGALGDVWVRTDVARRLAQAAADLQADRLGLLVLDGWRPRAVQSVLWERYRADLSAETGLTGDALDRRAREFVTPPGRTEPPPAHSTGGAVDLTLCTLDGQPLEMGGEFDELTDRSYPDYYERDSLTGEERAYRDRRRLLLRAMSSAGFWRLPTEWWHFEYGTTGWANATGSVRLFDEARPPTP